MDPLAQARSATYDVKVSGFWVDLRTKAHTQRTETFRVQACTPRAAQVAGEQLFTAAAAAQRSQRSGRCHAVAQAS